MKHKYSNLVFEGGGVKGIAYGGALSVLDDNGILKNIKRVAGTSAGAINATLLAIGYTHKEVAAIIEDTDFSTFADNTWIGGNLWRLIKKYGWNRGIAFYNFIGEKIEAKTGSKDFTFNNLESRVLDNADGFRYLYMAATNLSTQKHQIFSHESGHHPDTPIRDAVRMSMGIPLYFQSFRFNEDIMVDGGVSLNYPVFLFDHKKYLNDPANGEIVEYAKDPDYRFNNETLGFRLDSKEIIEYAKRDWATPPEQITNVKEYTGALVNFMMEMANKKHLHTNDWNRTIFIDTGDVKTTDFTLPAEKVLELTKSGKKSAKKYMEWKEGQ
jgi:NTE family protein